jgi:hypothetical protein
VVNGFANGSITTSPRPIAFNKSIIMGSPYPTNVPEVYLHRDLPGSGFAYLFIN